MKVRTKTSGRFSEENSPHLGLRKRLPPLLPLALPHPVMAAEAAIHAFLLRRFQRPCPQDKRFLRMPPSQGLFFKKLCPGLNPGATSSL